MSPLQLTANEKDIYLYILHFQGPKVCLGVRTEKCYQNVILGLKNIYIF
jgi:hypothetical protein